MPTATLCIDFDDTLRGRDDLPLQGAADALRRFRELGWEIIVGSSRLDPTLWGDELHFRVDEIKQWLDRHGMPYDRVVCHKPAADLYIDDKAFRFEGDWPQASRVIEKLLEGIG